MLEINAQTRDAQHLVDQVKERGEFVVHANAGALSDRVRHLSKTVFPRYKERVSSYVYRHQVSADLKASGASSTDVSTALGHSSDETKRYYGSGQSSRGGNQFVSIQGSQLVREKTLAKMQSLENSRERRYGVER